MVVNVFGSRRCGRVVRGVAAVAVGVALVPVSAHLAAATPQGGHGGRAVSPKRGSLHTAVAGHDHVLQEWGDSGDEHGPLATELRMGNFRKNEQGNLAADLEALGNDAAHNDTVWIAVRPRDNGVIYTSRMTQVVTPNGLQLIPQRGQRPTSFEELGALGYSDFYYAFEPRPLDRTGAVPRNTPVAPVGPSKTRVLIDNIEKTGQGPIKNVLQYLEANAGSEFDTHAIIRQANSGRDGYRVRAAANALERGGLIKEVSTPGGKKYRALTETELRAEDKRTVRERVDRYIRLAQGTVGGRILAHLYQEGNRSSQFTSADLAPISEAESSNMKRGLVELRLLGLVQEEKGSYRALPVDGNPNPPS